jgi:hypothetical protein
MGCKNGLFIYITQSPIKMQEKNRHKNPLVNYFGRQNHIFVAAGSKKPNNPL